MSCLKTSVVNVKINAFSLIELLLSLTISIFLLFCLGTIYVTFSQQKVKQKELFMLQKESRQIIDYLQMHIQHLGYQGINRQGSNFHLFEKNKKQYAIEKNDCLIFFYDLNGDGCLGRRPTKNAVYANNEVNNSRELAKEVFGFKAEKQEIYTYDKNKLENCIGGQCRSLLEGCNEKWKKFTSVTDFKVDKLLFSWLKEDVLLKVELAISSAKEHRVSYQVSSYVYILNGSDYADNKE